MRTNFPIIPINFVSEGTDTFSLFSASFSHCFFPAPPNTLPRTPPLRYDLQPWVSTSVWDWSECAMFLQNLTITFAPFLELRFLFPSLPSFLCKPPYPQTQPLPS